MKFRTLLVMVSTVAAAIMLNVPSAHAVSSARTHARTTAAARAKVNKLTSVNVVKAINQVRTAAHIRALKTNAQLTEAAQAKANDMLKQNYFAHTSPLGFDGLHFITLAGYNPQATGENLAYGFDTVDVVKQSWTASATHLKNILDSRFSDTGVGIATGLFQGHPTTVIVQLFGKPQPAATHS